MRNSTETLIVVISQFEGIHSWPDCPYEDVAFLRHPHRHIFHVIMKIEVYHDDRELEFIRIKRELEEILLTFYHGKDLGSMSCEMLAEKLGMHFIGFSYPVHMVSVFEDGENGAEVYFS